MESVAFGSLQGHPSVTIPSTVVGNDNVFSADGSCRTAHLNVLTINSQSFLDASAESGIGSFTVDSIKLGDNITGFRVIDGCLIQTSRKLLLKACRQFSIPGGGVVEIIDHGPFYTDFNGEPEVWDLPEIYFPEGVKEFRAISYSSTIYSIHIPHSTTYIHPQSLTGGSLMNIFYNGTMEEWIALTKKEKDMYDYWQYGSGLKVGCTDGVLQFRSGRWKKTS